jgi:hypothetical protein
MMDIDFQKTGNRKIDTCMKMLISIYEGSVPGERGFGISSNCLDLPPAQAQNAFALDLNEKVKEFLPGYEVDNVEADFSPIDGKMQLHVKIKKGGDE